MSDNLEAAIARLEERLRHVADEVRHVHEEVSDLKATANRWKGAFWVMVGVGGVAGTFVNFLIGWMGK